MAESYNQIIGKNLKKIREELGLTQISIAEKLDVSRDVIIKIEKGTRNITAEELNLLSKIYSKDISEIINNKQNNEIYLKGIILAGGSGTRLYPVTKATSKQLVCVYDKPMIYYPLSVLMLAGIKDILIITTPEEQNNFKKLLGNGSHFGLNLSYEIQPEPKGIAEAFIIGEQFIEDNPCAMILGDNIFYGNGLEEELYQASINTQNGFATVFGYHVKEPERFGVIEIDKNNKVLSIEEKPSKPKSDYAISGLYFYPCGVTKKVKAITPSKRGELEITTLNNLYLQEKKLKIRLLNDGYSWFDTGTFDSLLDASNMIKTIETNRDVIICCPEKIAYDNHWIKKETILKNAKLMSENKYGQYLLKIIEKECKKNEIN